MSCATKWFSKKKVSSQKMFVSTRTLVQRLYLVGSNGPEEAEDGSEAEAALSFLPLRPFLPLPLAEGAGRSSPAWCLKSPIMFEMDHSMTSEKIASSSMRKTPRRLLSACCLLPFLLPGSPSSSSSPPSPSMPPASSCCRSMDRTAVWYTLSAALQAVKESFAEAWIFSSLSLVRTLPCWSAASPATSLPWSPLPSSSPPLSAPSASSSSPSPSSAAGGARKSSRDLSCSTKNL
mmetsp:Transcript_80154/g.201666  ORF Transcript_80154/g.201666 Transcript_80154/m.201666 type:complete len:234 (+) Transcript_80154:1507-2208(+)